MANEPYDRENSAASNGGIDNNLQHELEDALSDIGLESLMDLDQTPSTATSTPGVRRGHVIAIHGDDIFVDMGGKSQGILPAEQFKDLPLPAEGDVVEVVIDGYDRADGLLLLSREGAVKAATWATLEEGQMVEGRVVDHNKGGLEMDINGIRAFMPISHIDIVRVEECAQYVNQRFKCQVIDVNEADRNVVVSRRAVLELEAAESREQAFQTLVEGQIVTGVVKSIMPYGAFVDIGGFDGLLHIGDMRHTRVEDPKDVVKEGQRLQVMVLKVDRDARKIGLGLKQILPDPWSDADAKYAMDEVVTGRVTRLADFGAFVELEEGVEGLVPMSEMSFERRIGHASEVVNVGDTVRVRVLNVDMDRHRISLSLKRVGDDPWVGASVRWPVDSVVEGTVKRIADFGAFIELAPGVEGLVHVSELSDAHVRAVSDVVREGQSVQAKVVSVDEERRRIALSIKQLAGMADYTGTPAEEEPPRPARKRKKPLKGGLEW